MAEIVKFVYVMIIFLSLFLVSININGKPFCIIFIFLYIHLNGKPYFILVT